MLYNTQSNDSYALGLSNNRDNGFTYEGAKIVIDYLDQLSDDIGKDINFDQVAIRCDFTEYSIEEYLSNYEETKELYSDYLLDEGKEDSKDSRIEFFEEEIKNSDDRYIAGESDCFIIRE